MHKYSIINELIEDNSKAVRKRLQACNLVRKFVLRIIRHGLNLWLFNLKRSEVLCDALQVFGELLKIILKETFMKFKVSRLKREETVQ